MVKRVAVFGSGGQLGVELVRVLEARGCETAAFDKASVDITDRQAVENAVANYHPAVILNAAAYNQVDLAETDPETAYRVNALGVRNLALAARGVDAALVHYSTDYVFDGETGEPYREEDPPHPLGAYAVSKLAGEMYARAYLDNALVIRVSAVFGPAGRHTNRGNFLEMMLRLAARSKEDGKPVRVVEDQVVSPTYAPALAERTAALLEKGARGLLHIGGGTPISWYEWAATIFAAAGVEVSPKAVMRSEFPTPARRPQFSALSNAKMESLGIAPMPSLEEALRDYFQRRSS